LQKKTSVKYLRIFLFFFHKVVCFDRNILTKFFKNEQFWKDLCLNIWIFEYIWKREKDSFFFLDYRFLPFMYSALSQKLIVFTWAGFPNNWWLAGQYLVGRSEGMWANILSEKYQLYYWNIMKLISKVLIIEKMYEEKYVI